ncbi:MAG: cellulose binding domain-containing protein [Polyangiaceae bacterium]
MSRASRVTASFSFSSGQSGTSGSYCGDVRVTNTSTTTVNGGWLVRLNLNQSALTTGWNGTFTSLGSSLYNLTPVAWNGTIAPGQFITASFCANKSGANFTPQVVFTQSN